MGVRGPGRQSRQRTPGGHPRARWGCGRVRGVQLTLRPAEPNRRDAAAYAGYLDTAADGLFTALFGSAMKAILTGLALRPGHELSLGTVTFAEVDGRVVGACSGCMCRAVTPAEWVRAAGPHCFRAVPTVLAARHTLAALTTRAPDEWYLQSIAVDPALRGAGVGTALFEDALARARAAGAARLVLDVDARNQRAQDLYERLGLSVERTSTPDRLAGGASVRRMGVIL